MEDNSIQHIPHNKPVAVTPEEIEKKIKSS